MADNFNLFKKNGGIFLTPPAQLKKKIRKIRAFIFDWDGVFSDSRKTGKGNDSYFLEVDSMGLNMLRFSNWLSRKQVQPFTAVVSGEDTETARYFLQREKFNAGYFKVKDKKIALADFCHRYNVDPSEVAFVFDDILDLSIAEKAGLSICVNRKANPLFVEYVKKNKLADYITGNESGQYPLREATELLMALAGNFNEVIHERVEHGEVYKKYISERNNAQVIFYTAKNEMIVKL